MSDQVAMLTAIASLISAIAAVGALWKVWQYTNYTREMHATALRDQRLRTRPILHVSIIERPSRDKLHVLIENIGQGPAVMLVMTFASTLPRENPPLGYLWHVAEDSDAKVNHVSTSFIQGQKRVLEMPWPETSNEVMLLEYGDLSRNRYQTQFLFGSPTSNKEGQCFGLCTFAEPTLQDGKYIQTGIDANVPEPYVLGGPAKEGHRVYFVGD